MNFKIAFVGAALMAFGGLFAVGCGGNKCEDASATISDYLKACPKPPAAMTTSTSGAAVECTDALGTIATCTATAITSAPCDCVGGGDPTKCTAAQATAFTTALSKCK